MINYNPLFCLDFYKTTHAQQYPADLRRLVSYYTPRTARIPGFTKLPLVGLQAFIKEYLIDAFDKYFFNRPFEDVCFEYISFLGSTLSTYGVGLARLMELHKLGYLPIKIRALPEGTRSDIKVPQIEISNTHPKFVCHMLAESIVSIELTSHTNLGWVLEISI